MKRFFTFLMILSVVTLLLVACIPSTGDERTSTATQGGNEVHMGEADFEQSSIIIQKGSSINLIDDTSVAHLIKNGSWDDAIAKPAIESGAPLVNVQFQGDDRHMIGPFNVAGTFHLYCTLHETMNLTVVVQ